MGELEITQKHGLALLGRMVVINFKAGQTREKYAAFKKSKVRLLPYLFVC